MKKYQITYMEDGECYSYFCWAYDKKEAEESFVDPDAGYKLEMIVSIKRHTNYQKPLTFFKSMV